MMSLLYTTDNSSINSNLILKVYAIVEWDQELFLINIYDSSSCFLEYINIYNKGFLWIKYFRNQLAYIFQLYFYVAHFKIGITSCFWYDMA